jgi:hypothetical protein
VNVDYVGIKRRVSRGNEEGIVGKEKTKEKRKKAPGTISRGSL